MGEISLVVFGSKGRRFIYRSILCMLMGKAGKNKSGNEGGWSGLYW